jgi:hypothetical protein
MRKFAIAFLFSLVGVGFTVITAAADAPCCWTP